ncbi:MAG TPA: trypsin-like peptidase domain-containing protein [Pyrinomonadaceae bacterium]|nr:trypsin-like peptidase domain-containing protein [Pyrinomonadaceae bacterium]
MASHVCPRCGKKGPVVLREGQVCNSCKSNWAWSSFANSNQGITISQEILAEPDAKPAAKPVPVAKPSTGTWVLLVSSLVLSAAVIVLVIYFFRHQSSIGLSGVSVLNRFNTLASIAGALSLLAVGLSASVAFIGVQKNYKQTAFRIAGAVSIVVAVAVFMAALVCWSRTERVRSLAVQSTSNDAMVQRLQNATVVVQAHDPQTSRYRSAKRGGIIIAAQAGRIFILTAPYFDADGKSLIQPEDLWVNFTDGRTLPGRFRLASANPTSIAIVEVEGENPPAQVQFHPAAEAIIPSQSVLAIPNPIYGWRYEQATVLSRFSGRRNTGWNCVVTVDLTLQPMDLGSAIYDESGRLLGIMTSPGEDGYDSQFAILDSATVSEIEKLRDLYYRRRSEHE